MTLYMTTRFYELNNRIPAWGILLALLFLTQTNVLVANNPTDKVEKRAVQKLSGTISDEKGAGLPGVSIVKKGTSIGVITDIDGKYAIDANSGDVLIFSFVGYTTQEIAITNQTTLDLRLEPDAKSLGEIVVTGYGTQKKRDFVGAATSLKAAAIQEMPSVTSVESAMQGRMTGVQVQQSSGQPGAGVSIRIRGVTSMAGGNEPLFVIDGVPQYNNDNRALNGLSSLNSSDIESIEVLKDASSTAMVFRLPIIRQPANVGKVALVQWF